MKSPPPRRWFTRAALLLAALCAGMLAACSSMPVPPPASFVQPLPVRFALTFDDGPSGEAQDNPTESILSALADNTVQPGIKAVFFVQTRIPDAGASERGRALLALEHRQGHVLGLHTATSSGHRSHRGLSDDMLEQSLRDGVSDLRAVAGRPPTLVRPPYWAYDDRTVAAYARHGLEMLLTDISANDGKTWGFKASPRRYIHMASEMRKVLARIQHGELAAHDGAIPVVVTFHDTNSYTAEHMREYIGMIADEARKAGIVLAARPFYDTAESLEAAALTRARDTTHRSDMTPWWWRWIQW